MFLNALGASRDSGPFRSATGERGPAAGLRAFDDLSHTIAARRDLIVRDVALAARAGYPRPEYASPAAAGTMLGAAVAAFAGSDVGRATIERAIAGAAALLKGVLGAAAGGPTQLRLPFE